MAILNGTDLKVYSSATTTPGLFQYLVAFAQNCTLNINHTARDITNKESEGFKEISESIRDWSIDVDGAYAWTGSTGKALATGADDMVQHIGLTTTVGGIPATLSAIVDAGSGYPASPTTFLSTTGGTGFGLKVDITIAGGEVQTVAIRTAGSGYTLNDTITIVGGNNDATFTIASLGTPVTTNNLRQSFVVRFGGATSGSTSDVSYSGDVYLTSLTLTGGTEDTATYSLTLEGDGDLTQVVST